MYINNTERENIKGNIKHKAYRPNAHLFDIIMQLKYQFVKLSLTKKHMNFNMHTLPAITQCMDH